MGETAKMDVAAVAQEDIASVGQVTQSSVGSDVSARQYPHMFLGVQGGAVGRKKDYFK